MTDYSLYDQGMLALGVGWVKELRDSSPEILRELCKMRLDMKRKEKKEEKMREKKDEKKKKMKKKKREKKKEKEKEITYRTVNLDIATWFAKKERRKERKEVQWNTRHTERGIQ